MSQIYDNNIMNIIKKKLSIIPFIKGHNKEGKYCELATKLKKFKMIRSIYLVINRNLNVFKKFKYKKFAITLKKKSNELSREIDIIVSKENTDDKVKRYLYICKKNFQKPGQEIIDYYLTAMMLLNRTCCLDINRYIMKFL